MGFTFRRFAAALLPVVIVSVSPSLARPPVLKQPAASVMDPLKEFELQKQGNANLANGDYDGAIKVYGEALKIGDPAMRLSLLIERGWAYMARPETYDSAFQDFEEIVRTRPDATAGYLWRGVLRFIIGKTELARQDLSEAMKRNPDFPDTVNWSYIIGKRLGVEDTSAMKAALAKIPDGKQDALNYDLFLEKLTPEDVIVRAAGNRFSQCTLKTYAAELLILKKENDMAALRFKEALQECKASSNLAPGWTIAVARAELRALELQRNNVSENAPKSKPVLPQTSLSIVANLPKDKASSTTDLRIALVIGNSKYKNVPALSNPTHDAEMVADVLKRVGFAQVTTVEDADKDTMTSALRKFANDAERADWAVVYYAGHGMEVGGVNYLIPVDARLATDRDISFEAVPLDQVINSAERASKLRLVILDACRDNPFKSQMKRTLAVASRSVSRGLVPIEPDPGMLVVYSAKGGEQASDGDGNYGPFATAFAKDIMIPGLEVRRLFDFVRDDVLEATHREQQPFSYGSISGRQDFFFLAPVAKAVE